MNTQNTRLGINARLRTVVAWCLIFSYQFYSSAAFAQGITGAVGSLHAPEVLQSSNGLPIVNINRPSSGGVSRNEYDKFNVDKQGALLNNSSDIVLTQQAGYIDGNSALAGQSARIILNEVVTANPSHLRGYTEVAGAAAEVVIANPNGITCNGCGFINSPRSVLTTGRAQFNTQGNLTGYRVEGGRVTIEGDGLNASNLDQLDILARAVRVNSELWANKLNLVTGKNKIDHKTLKATPLPSSDTSGVALDVATIGGMYANRISLIGTEKGFGVNSQGQITASQDFQLTSEGKVQLGGITRSQASLSIATTDTLENSGILTAKNIQTTARRLQNNSEEAVIHADEQLQLTVTEGLHNQGRIQAETLIAQSQLFENQGAVSGQDVVINSHEVHNQGKDSVLHGRDTLNLQSDALNNEGSIQGQELTLNVAASLDNQGKVMGDEIQITSSQLTNQATGSIHSKQGSVDLQTSELTNEGVVVAQQLDVTTEELHNSGGMQGLTVLELNLGTLTNLGQLLGSLLNLDATQVHNQGTVSGGETRITAQEVHNQGKDSVLHGRDTLNLQSDTLNNEGLILADNTSIDTVNLNNAATGKIRLQDSSLQINETLNNKGQISTRQGQITTATLNNTGADALISAENHLDLQLGSGGLRNEGVIQADGLKINAARLINALGGQLLVLKELGQIALTDYLNNSGQIYGQQLEISTNKFQQQGADAWTVAENDLALHVAQGLTNTTRLQSGDDFTLHAQSLNNQGQGNIRSRGHLDIQLPGKLTNAGQIQAGSANITSLNLNNASAGQISTVSDKLAITTGNLENSGFLLGHSVDVTAAQLKNTHKLEATYQLNTTVTGLLQNSAKLSGSNTTINAGSLTNLGNSAEIYAEQKLNISTNQNLRNTGTLIAGNLLLKAKNLVNTGSKALIAGMQYLEVDARSKLSNLDSAMIFGDGNASLKSGGTLLNESSEIEASGNLVIQAGSLINKKEQFVTQANVTTTDYNDIAITPPSGYYKAERSYTETVTTTEITKDSAASRILSGQNLTIVTTQGNIDNYYSTISAGGSLNYNAAALNNVAAVATNTVERSGTDTFHYTYRKCHTRIGGKCVDRGKTRHRQTDVAYNPSPVINLVTLASAVISGNTALSGRGGSLSNHQRDFSLNNQPFDSVDVTARETLNQSLVTNPLQTPTSEQIDDPTTDSWMPATWKKGEAGFKLPDTGLMSPSSQPDHKHLVEGPPELPDTGLMSPNNQPDHKYLVETNPRLTDYREFISSDYMIQRLDHNPDVTVKRLGDGFVEQRMVRDQILNLTGTQYLGNHQNIEQQYLQLMENALQQGKNLSLRPGIALTATQIEQLRKPLVWMVEETFETTQGTETALVPRVYLGNAWDGHLRPDGAFVAAGNLDLDLDNQLNNQGTLLATENLNIRAHSITNTQDLLAEKQLSLNTQTDLINQSGLIEGDQVLLDVGGDLIHETLSQEYSHKQADGSLASTQTQLGRTASIQGGQVSLITGGDLNITGADIYAEQNLRMNIGGDARINALKTLESQHSNTTTASRASFSNTELDWKTSSINAGGSLELVAKGELTSAGTDWKSGSDMLLDAKDITLSAVTSLSESYQHMDRGLKGSVTKNLLKETVIGNLIQAGGNLVLTSVGDIVSISTEMLAQNGTLALFAGNDVILDAETERDYEYSKKSRKSDGMLSSTRRTSTSTRETTQTLGNKLSAQDIQIQAGGLAHLHAAQLDSENNIAVSATDIAITSGIDQTYKQDTATKKTTFRRHTSDRGSLAQTAAGSELKAANIQLQASGGIQLTASDLSASNDLTIGNLTVEQQADGSFKSINGEGTPEQLVVDTLELRNQDWNHKTKSYRGAAATVAKAATVVASAALEVLAPGISKPEITLSESSSDTTTRITQQNSELNAGNNLVMAAQKQIQVIAGELSAKGNAILTADNISLDAAEETHTTESTRSRESVGGVAASVSDDEITLGGLELNKETRTERTTNTTHQGSSINAGNLVMLADQDISILASDVNVEGAAVLQAEGDITIGGRQSETVTETHEETETTRITAGVRNAYVDTAHAAVAVKDATKAVDEANDAYRDARRRVERGELTESALKDYETNRAAATAQLAQAQIAAGSAVAGAATTAAGSMGTGFYGSVRAEHTQTSTQASVIQNTWQGSSISAGSLTLNSTNATLQGSDITAGLLNLGSQNTLITAGLNETQTQSSRRTDTQTASLGTNGTGSLGASTQQSESQSNSTAHVNSRIRVGHLQSNSDNLTLQGADVQTQTADLSVGHLTVASLQDTARSTNASRGNNAGVSLGSGSASVNVGHNQSQGSSEGQQVNQQTQLLIAEGQNSQITAQNITLNGGLIANATRDENGNLTDHGQLNLTTGTLNVSHLDNQTHSEQRGFGIQTGLGIQQTENDDFQLSGGSSTLSLHNQGQVTEGRTQATLGGGTIQVGGQTLNDSNSLEGLNRDLSQSQITTRDQQTGGLKAGITVDHRLLTQNGREEILDQQKDLGDNSKKVLGSTTGDLARVVAVVGSTLDLSLEQTTNAWKTVGKGQELAYTDDGKLAGNVEDLRDGNIQDGPTLQGGLQQTADFIHPEDGQQVRITENATTQEGTPLYGAAHQDSNTMYVDIADNRLNSLVNTVAHEGMHLKGAGETNATSTGLMTDLTYRVNAWANNDQISENRVSKPIPIQNPTTHQQLLGGNNQLFNEQDERGELDYRQLHDREIELVKSNSGDFAQLLSISPAEAESRLLKTANSQTDQEYSQQHAQTDSDAQNFLRGISEVMDLDGERMLSFAPSGYYEDSNKFADQTGFETERKQLANQPVFTQGEKNQQIRGTVTDALLEGGTKGIANAGIDAVMGLPEAGVAIVGSDWQAPRIPYSNEAAAQVGQDVGGLATGTVGVFGLFKLGSSLNKQATSNQVSNPVPDIVARVVPDNPITRASGTLGRPGADDVFVTAADDIRGLNAKQISERLTIPESPAGFRVIEFLTPRAGIASPVNRNDPGFIGGGRTLGGAREFVIPNGTIPTGSSSRTVP